MSSEERNKIATAAMQALIPISLEKGQTKEYVAEEALKYAEALIVELERRRDEIRQHYL
ncbi:MAG: hypothetical protein ABI876_01530 [Bacteroidota bacterium]